MKHTILVTILVLPFIGCSKKEAESTTASAPVESTATANTTTDSKPATAIDYKNTSAIDLIQPDSTTSWVNFELRVARRDGNSLGGVILTIKTTEGEPDRMIAESATILPETAAKDRVSIMLHKARMQSGTSYTFLGEQPIELILIPRK